MQFGRGEMNKEVKKIYKDCSKCYERNEPVMTYLQGERVEGKQSHTRAWGSEFQWERTVKVGVPQLERARKTRTTEKKKAVWDEVEEVRF